MRLQKDFRFDRATLLLTALAVALALMLLLMLGQESPRPGAVTVVAGLTVLAAGLAYLVRRRGQRGTDDTPLWVRWADTSESAPAPRRSMLPYVGLFTLVYGVLVTAAVVASARFALSLPVLVYLLFIAGADQLVLRQFAQRVRRPLSREELVVLYSGTALIIVLAELPSLLAVSRQGAWTSTTITLYLVIAALVFTLHYFALTRLPSRAVRRLGLPETP